MVIGGVSTVLFNGNPLLRFDGYYVLSDVLDVPNLGPRSNQYVAYLAQRYLLKVHDAASPVTAKGEPVLLLSYALLSFLYRWFVSILIVLWAGAYSFWLGVAAGLFIAVGMVIKPLHNAWQFLRTAPQLARNRSRAYAIAGGIAVATLRGAIRAAGPVLDHGPGRGLAAREGTRARGDRRLRRGGARAGRPAGQARRSPAHLERSRSGGQARRRAGAPERAGYRVQPDAGRERRAGRVDPRGSRCDTRRAEGDRSAAGARCKSPAKSKASW